jgi:hypothetical protein
MPQPSEHGENQEDELAIDDEEEAERDVLMVDQVFASSAECGICYKQGFVPGYLLYGQERRILTTINVADAYGYNINESSAPNTFDMRDTKDGFISFVLEVPKYFGKANYSIRNNTRILPDAVLYTPTGALVTLAYLKQYAGTTCIVQVKEEHFTHVALNFDVGGDPILANLAQGTKTLDWTMFDTFGTIQMVLPMTIAEVAIADVIFVPTRNMSFKVTDVNYLRTATDHIIDWQVTVRILQPQESLKHIHIACPL